jgi:hypothetical protein
MLHTLANAGELDILLHLHPPYTLKFPRRLAHNHPSLETTGGEVDSTVRDR